MSKEEDEAKKKAKEAVDKLIEESAKTAERIEKEKQAKKPQLFGNRCNRCGGYADEGGICNCGYDHFLDVDHRRGS